MNNSLKNIPKQFLKNTSFTNNYITSIGISSTQNKEKTSKNANNVSNDNIWILIILLIILDII